MRLARVRRTVKANHGRVFRVSHVLVLSEKVGCWFLFESERLDGDGRLQIGEDLVERDASRRRHLVEVAALHGGVSTFQGDQVDDQLDVRVGRCDSGSDVCSAGRGGEGEGILNDSGLLREVAVGFGHVSLRSD